MGERSNGLEGEEVGGVEQEYGCCEGMDEVDSG